MERDKKILIVGNPKRTTIEILEKAGYEVVYENKDNDCFRGMEFSFVAIDELINYKR